MTQTIATLFIASFFVATFTSILLDKETGVVLFVSFSFAATVTLIYLFPWIALTVFVVIIFILLFIVAPFVVIDYIERKRYHSGRLRLVVDGVSEEEVAVQFGEFLLEPFARDSPFAAEMAKFKFRAYPEHNPHDILADAIQKLSKLGKCTNGNVLNVLRLWNEAWGSYYGEPENSRVKPQLETVIAKVLQNVDACDPDLLNINSDFWSKELQESAWQSRKWREIRDLAPREKPKKKGE